MCRGLLVLGCWQFKVRPNLSLNPDASPAALCRPLGAGQLGSLGSTVETR
jgi:hypothetical protein